MSSIWKKLELKEIIDLKYGKGLPKKQRVKGKFPVYGSGGIIDFHDCSLLNGPNIIIGRKGSIGTVYYEEKNCFPIDTVFYVELKDSGTHLKFVYSLLKNLNLSRLGADSAVPGLNRNAALKQEIKIPDLNNQKKIASVLSVYDKLIEKNTRRIEILEEMAQRIYKEWFVDFKYPGHENDKLVDSELGMIPEGWDVGTLQDIATFSNGYAFKSKELLKENTGTCYHIFKMGHIKKGGGFDDTRTKSFIDKSKCEKLEKYILKYGDLLMCMTDMKANVALLGHTALMNIDNEYILNQRVGLIRAKNDCSIDFPYLYILTNSRSFINDLRSRANSGVQVNLSTNEIKATKVLIPPKDINLKFNAIVRPIRDVITKYQNKNKNLRLTRDYLLPKLISGKVDVSDLDINTGILDD